MDALTPRNGGGCTPHDAHLRRLRYWRRALGRGIGGTATRQLKLQLDTCAALEARRECVLADPAATPSDVVQITREARLARRILNKMIQARRPAPPAPMSLGEYLASRKTETEAAP
jgi:hypothetical protein